MATSITWASLGCVSVLSPAPSVVTATPPANVISEKPAQTPEASLSGALDGPTLRLAMRDLAIILDTLGRLEQVRPELKSEMLRELADADGATAAIVVQKWRRRLDELQPVNDSRLASMPKPEARKPAPPAPTIVQTAAISPAPPAPTPPVRPAPRLVLEMPPEHEQSPNWDQTIQQLISQTRERTESDCEDAARARVQAALLELLWASEQNARDGEAPDRELWVQLAPALELCLGVRADPPAEAIDSLQVAIELLRGPDRFRASNLAFCRRIRGFGSVDRIDQNTFVPGQPVLLYSEVEHFMSVPEPDGFRTRIGSTLELLNSDGEVVWRQEFAAVDDHSAGPRRDYFLTHSLKLPATLKSGTYVLKLTLADELANRQTTSSVSLTIRGES